MTRAEFERIQDFDELIDLAWNYEAHYLPDGKIVSFDEMNDEIYDGIGDYLCDNSWENLRDALSSIDANYSYYIRLGSLNYQGLSYEDFASIKSHIRTNLEEGDVFDDEDEETAQSEVLQESDTLDVSKEPIQYTEFLRGA